MPDFPNLAFEFTIRCWATLCELSPWLLFGMFISGVLHVAVPKNLVRRRFRGFSGVVQSVLLGVPLPLCSCGVIPAGIGLKNDGASDGASVGFLISTPQTGIDSILVSASFFGWPFAIFKMATAAVTGVVGGWLADATGGDLDEVEASELSIVDSRVGNSKTVWWRELWSHAIEVLQSIWLWLLIGVAISALIGTFGFEHLIKRVGDAGLLPAMLLMLLISIPLYVCATASVPIAAALVQSGLPPAVALVFLMAGPATNVTTMGAIRQRFGWRVMGIYLSTLIVGSFLAAFLFDWVLDATVATGDAHVHDHQNWLSIVSAIVVLLLIGQIVAKRYLIPKQIRNDSTIELSVSGMHCGSCVSRIETAVENMPNVDSVRVDLGQGIASVNGGASVEQIATVIEDLGFSVDPTTGENHGQ
ncbi:permease [Mariniblastus fucicola]|uniref:Copper-exporting P-type ATPase A n=1 Tax=Mariniblastus fucicola TaxID=980251 RepID=A0A5B9PS56_9BACT|nr:permease [Mariniblastus fucicola]QEG25053.1 Copper-exporting P-type ATPase A [Mariniblastus fucicola]